MDRMGADFERTLSMIAERLTDGSDLPMGRRPIAVQIPLGSEESFKGAVDLIRMRSVTHADDLGAEVIYGPIPPEMQEQAELYRETLVEALAELDDDVAEKYLEGLNVEPEQLIAVLRRATISNQLFPVLCGSSLHNKGVQTLLDAIVDYLPSPLDVPPPIRLSVDAESKTPGEDSHQFSRPADSGQPGVLAALAFKVQTDPYMGRLVYFRVYSGALRSGARVYNVNKKKSRAPWLFGADVCRSSRQCG
jgi:elongation factor G